MFDWLLSILLFGSLFVFIPSRADGDELYTIGSLAFLAALSLIVRKRRTVPSAGLFAILAYAIMTTTIRFRYPVYASTLNLFVAIFAMKSIAERISLSRQAVRRIGYALFVWAAVSLPMLALQLCGLDRWYGPFFGDGPSGFSFRPWILGCTAAMSAPFIAAVHPLAPLILIPLLVFGHSTACVLAAGTALFFLMRPVYRLISFVGGLIFVCLYLVFVDHGVDSARFEVWSHSWKYFNHLLLGSGLGSWAHDGFLKMNGAQQYHWRWAHNEFFQHLYEQGAIGVTIVLLWLTAILVRVRKTPMMLSCLSSVLILSMFHPILHWGKLSFMVIVIFAMALATAKEGKFYE